MSKRTLNQYFNIKSFKAYKDSAEKGGFTDAAGIIIKENLKQVDPTIFEKKFPALAILNSGIQADNTGGYSEVIQSLRTQPTGEFKISGDNSDNKGKISLQGESSQIQVISKEAQSDWSDTDLKQAAMQNINLQQSFLSAHVELYQRDVDTILALGTGKVGSYGLFNYSGWTTDTATVATGQEKYDAVAAVIFDQHNQVFNTIEYMADTVILPVANYNNIARSILNSAGSEMSVLSALKKNFPDINFLASARATKIVAYSTNSQAMKARIPVPLEVSEIVKIAFKYHVESKHRIAGLDILESTSGRYLDLTIS